MELSGSDFAKLVDCRRQNIYKLVRERKLIKNDNGKYDTDNIVNSQYLIDRGVKKSDIENLSKSLKKPKKTKKVDDSLEKKPKIIKKEVKVLPKNIDKKIEILEKKKEIKEEDLEDIAGLPEKMMGLTIMELVRQYGGPMRLEKWASILQKLMTAQKTQVAIERDRLKLIEKDFVISQVFKFIDEFINKILDSVDAQNEIIFSLVKSGADEAKIKIKKMRLDNYSKLAKDAKKIITNNLEKMKDKYNNDK